MAGDEPAAYAGLLRLHETDEPEVALQLYWLLLLDPSLDSTRTRHQWLATALTIPTCRGPALDLYSRELETNPDDALGQVYAQPSNELQLLLGIARLRIATAGRLDRTDRMLADLTALKPILEVEADEAWLGLLVCAFDWAFWRPASPVEAFVVAEVERLRHLHFRSGDLFDRLDAGGLIAQSLDIWRAADVPDVILQLARSVWAEVVIRPSLVEAAAAAVIAFSEERPVTLFDELGNEETILRLVLSGFQRYLHHLESIGHLELPLELLNEVAEQLIHGRAYSYSVLRPYLLRMLIDLGVTPRELIETCSIHPDPLLQSYAASMSTDFSLTVVWLAARIRGN